MLRPRALTELLAQANTDGVLSTFLFKQDGTLLAHASAPVAEAEPRVMAAIASNIWAIYDKVALWRL
jgi:hypothetical protein